MWLSVKIDSASDLVFVTYHMVDWGKIEQHQSSHRCVQCGGLMAKVEQAEDRMGRKFGGLACHTCKRLIWLRED